MRLPQWVIPFSSVSVTMVVLAVLDSKLNYLTKYSLITLNITTVFIKVGSSHGISINKEILDLAKI
jgi:hypothetical protein